MPTSHPLVGEPDPETLVTCPYNDSHRVARKRMQFHVTKCRKGHPDAKKEVCPFNATHMVNIQEFQFHLEVCPSKGIIDNFKYVTPNENHVIELPPEPVLPPQEENWDNEYCGTYEPSTRVADAPIIHTFIGGTRSERKKCRVQQRQKFRALDETVPVIKEESKVAVDEKLMSDEQPLRQPNTLPATFPNNSDRFASLNRSFASTKSEPVEFTSTSQQPSGVLGNGRSESAAMIRPPNAASGVARSQDRPGPSRGQDDDDFIVFKPKGRGKFRN